MGNGATALEQAQDRPAGTDRAVLSSSHTALDKVRLLVECFDSGGLHHLVYRIDEDICGRNIPPADHPVLTQDEC